MVNQPLETTSVSILQSGNTSSNNLTLSNGTLVINLVNKTEETVEHMSYDDGKVYYPLIESDFMFAISMNQQRLDPLDFTYKQYQLEQNYWDDNGIDMKT